MSGELATVMRDKSDANVIRCERIDDDGCIEIAIFSGPRAVERSLTYAAKVYGVWTDPDELQSLSEIASLG